MSKKPKLGQNFLIDENACLRIANSLGDVSDRTVAEIGPGHGAITGLLATRCARLHCIEFDPALARELTFRYRNDPHITIHHGDILQTDLTQLTPHPSDLTSDTQNPATNATLPPQPESTTLSSRPESAFFADEAEISASTPPPNSTASNTTSHFLLPTCTLDIVGNLPYYITSDILLHLFAAARQGVLGRAVLMIQREVADRIAAAPGSSDYGPLTAITQLHAQVTNLFTLPPAAFNPPPDVFSTVVRLEFAPRFAELGLDVADFEAFNRFLRASFAQKRKTLANNLRNAGYSSTQLAAAWPAGIAPQARSEELPLEVMATLYCHLTTGV